MSIKHQSKEEILSQINYLEQNISKGSVAYKSNIINRLRSLKFNLRKLQQAG